jgi:agmatinase
MYTRHHPVDNFLGIEQEFSTYEKSRVAVWPIPYEKTTSYGTGTRHGPRAIISASQYVEFYDDDNDYEPYRIGIHTLPEMTEISQLEELKGIDRIYQLSRKYLADDKFLLTLGGEHTLSSPIIRALKEKFPDLSVLQIDAHADLRDTYEGTPYSHASIMRRVMDICPAVQVGIRSISREEKEAARSLPTKIFYAKDIVGRADWIPHAVASLSDHVYFTVDVDGLDPCLVPTTGTPEPGGLGWYDVIGLLRETARSKKIVAADIVELMPVEGIHAPDFLCAKLAYKIISYAFAKS